MLLQLAVILLVARGFGALFRRFNQPSVVGEVVAGIVMGPSLFGLLFPDAFHWLFRPGMEGVPDLDPPGTPGARRTAACQAGPRRRTSHGRWPRECSPRLS